MSTLPQTSRKQAHGLQLHLNHWPAADGDPKAPEILFLHGFADCGYSFRKLAPKLTSLGYQLFAPDLRGFGKSDWVGGGGYYHFPDYVADIHALTAHWVDSPGLLVGHSMGGTVASMFAGVRSSKLRGLVLLEGLGPPDFGAASAPSRCERWLDQLAKGRVQGQKTMADEAAVLARLRRQHPQAPVPWLEELLPHLAEKTDGGWQWRFDPYHRTTSPFPFMSEIYCAYAKRVKVPTLAVDGGPTGFHPPDEPQRLKTFAELRTACIEDAGHMMHWTRPEPLCEELATFAQEVLPLSR